MTPLDLLRHRLANQQLGATHLRTPHEVVAWFGAMQAQEFAMAKWAVSLRLPGTATDATIHDAFNRGAILRTHVLRPTWHFVAPADIRWMIALTAPRVQAFNAYMNRQLGLDRTIFKRSNAAIVKALTGGQHLTRAALEPALRRAKVPTDGTRLAHLLMQAELDALVCSGPRVGQQFTYALLDERVPPAKPVSHDAALAELSRRYFTSRGPATARDFAWWSGLTLTDARAGIASLGSTFVHETIGGQTYVRPATSALPSAPAPASPTLTRTGARSALPTFFMPDYDEYGIAYKERTAMFASPGYTGLLREPGVAYNRMLVVDGRIVGSWKRTESAQAVDLEVVPFDPLSPAAQKKLAAAAERFSRFVGKPVTLQVR